MATKRNPTSKSYWCYIYIASTNNSQISKLYVVILCIVIVGSTHLTMTNNFQTSKLYGVILCIVIVGPAHLTIHNIHYAPFVCRRPAAQSAVFICSYFIEKTYCYIINLTSYFNFLNGQHRKNSSYTHPKYRILSSKNHPP